MLITVAIATSRSLQTLVFLLQANPMLNSARGSPTTIVSQGGCDAINSEINVSTMNPQYNDNICSLR